MRTPPHDPQLRRRALLGGSAALVVAAGPAPETPLPQSAPPQPAPPQPAGGEGQYELVRNWTFGRRPEATISDMAALAREFRFRYIYDGGKLDGLPAYWSRHRDYPEGDPRSLHVFEDDALVLKARIPPGGGLHPGGIESGMLRALLPVIPGHMLIEMRARLPRGLGTWPAFWLNPGVEQPDGHFSATPWPPEIDIFEFFVWQGRTQPRIMTMHVQTGDHPAAFGPPADVYNRGGGEGYDPGIDFSAGFHTFALDWQPDLPTWILDGQRIKQTRYLWPAPPAHILVTNQIGMTLGGVDLNGMQVNEADWDYTIDYLRVWKRI